MHPSKFAIRNPATIYVLIAMILSLGWASFQGLPREASPDIQVPLLIVTIPFPGASPEDVEALVTNRAERMLQNVDNLKEISSTSAEGAAAITLEFELGFDVDVARTKVREALSELKPELPEDTEEPIITEINLAENPMLFVSLSGQVGLLRLKEVADDLKDDIRAIKGVLDVRLAGGLQREIKVYVDPDKLRYYQVALNQVTATVSGENSNIPGGALEIGPTKYLIRIPGEFQTPSEIENLAIAAPNQVPILIKDVGRVVDGFQEVTSRSRVNGREAVSLAVIKRAGENLLRVRSEIQDLVAEYGIRHGPRIKLDILSDEGQFVLNILRDLQNNIITGFFLVLVVLLVALGGRSAFFVASAIPMSFLLALMVMEALGFTLNFVVLFSLILSLGMLVDNAIVVVENIYRHLEMGKPSAEAAWDGVREMAVPVTTSTITTLAAFGPIMFMPGIMGEFMGFLPKTLILALSSSLFVALLINPVLCSTLMHPPTGSPQHPPPDPDAPVAMPQGWLVQFYRRTLEFALDRRGLVLGLTGVLFVAVTALYIGTTLRTRGTEFFPQTEPDWTAINVKAAVGTTLDVSDAFVREVEQALLPFQASVDSVVANVGQRRGFGGSEAGGTVSHLSYVQVKFPKWQDWDLRPSAVIEAMQSALHQMTGVEVKVARAAHGPPTGPPVNIEIHGEEFREMLAVADTIKRRIRDLPGLINLADDFDRTRPELRVLIDREKTARLGLRTKDVATTVRTAFNGRKVSEFRDGLDDYDIVVRLEKRFRLGPNDLERLTIVTPAGEHVPLSDLAAVRTGPAIGAIRHKDLERVITVSGDAGTGFTGPVLLGQVKQRLADFETPRGIKLAYTGQQEDVEESQAFLLRAFFIAQFLIFMVLVTQFNSVATPFIILSAVVLSLMGVFLGLMVHDRPFSILMTGIGTISLAGIVVNNAIVLIDYINQLRARGYPVREAVVLAGAVRLRPVLLTAVTTVLALLPVVIGLDIDFFHWPIVSFGGESGSFWVPMALAVMYGLSVATLLTLVVLPVLYLSVESLKALPGRLLARWKRAPAET